MTKEQLIDEVMVAMSYHLDAGQLNVLNVVLGEKLRNVDIAEPLLPATYEQTNDKYIEMFNILKGNKLSPKTMKAYNSTLNMFCNVVNKLLTKVTAIDVEYFLNYISKTNKERSLNNHRRNLSAFFTWMRKKKIRADNPCDEVETYKEVQKPIDHLEAVEKERLKTGCVRERDRALIEFLRCTGLRVGEISPLKVSDVDLQSGKVIVYGQKTKTFRPVYLDKVAKEYMMAYLSAREAKAEEPLFQSYKSDKPLGIYGINNSLKSIAKRANMDRRVYTHLFRHTVATDIVRKGGSMSDAGEYLGHKESSVTGRHYTFIDDGHIEKIFNTYVATV